MFFHNKSSLSESRLLFGATDFHSHLLPGVDDGVRTMEESLQILAEYETYGIREVWLTPHIMEDMPNETDKLRERFAELQSAYTGPIELYLAAENMLDNLFEERLEKGDLLPLGKEGNHLLVETSYFNPPMDLQALLSRIRSAGYYPVLAHPERYAYMEKEDYRQLKEQSIKFQLNLFSLVGYYGPYVRKQAEWLLKNGMIDLFGTDTHSLTMFTQAIHLKQLHRSMTNRLITSE